ncbi:MAG: molybdopterin-dependent oxidoreductase, partial [Methanocalculus sp.]|nr:molybdopterin-dependent oxidoreductase [Methanocalculus sp.]
MPVAGATTELQIVKYASDGETVLNETTVSYEWIETNLPVIGDGVTHYYLQGPVFDDPWNDAEDLNLKDQGAVKGSDVKDLCEIIGGASPGDIIKIKANDGFSKNFPYANVYTPESRQGPIGITWYLDGDGYVPGYSSGMKLIFFADTSVNPDGLNVFGISDMKETFPEEYWYYYEAGIPTTTGLSVKYVSRIEIMSNEEPPAGPATLFDGELDLQDETFSLEATSGTSYDVERLTPLGALDAADLNLTVNDKSFGTKGILLLDGINEYLYDKTAGTTWICTVNGQTLDDYGSPDTDGLNIYELKDGDIVEFYFGVKPVTPETATAYIRIEVSVGGGTTPEDWTLELNGKLNEIIDKTSFEEGVDCDHSATYTDDDGNVWSGMPLWFLVGYVDDDKKHGNNAFNDELAEQGYSIKVIAGDDYSINFQSAAVARNDNIIVANKLNGEPLPATIGEKNKPCFPLQLVGSDVSSGQKIGNIAKVELIGLPEPETEWSILLDGAFRRILTQSEFEEGVACGHAAAYTDADNNVWTGVPLWYILAIVDDINADNHWKFNDDRSDTGYTVTISAEDGYSKTFNSADIARNNNYILANKMNAAPLSAENGYPLKLQGPDLTSGQRVGTIASIKLNGLPEEPQEGEWVLTLKGKLITATISQSLFEEVAAAHGETYDDGVSTWRGVPLWLLAALVDDDKMRGANSFNEDLAETGYTVIVSSGGASPYSKDFTSQDIAENKSNYIVANQVNGTAIPGNAFPLRLVGEGAPGSKSVGNIETIELTAFDVPTEAPTVRIVRYAADGVTVVNEVTKDYLWMKENLLVYGGEDGIRLRFQGPTFDPNDLWNPAETINPGKVDEVVRGTSIKDLCDLVGGAPENSEIILRASDGYEMKINDTNLNSPLERQGEAIIAWWTERQGYVPDYSDGYRLFFNAPDGVFGADDMRATLKEDYWHYYWSDGIQYPSAAGCSNKLISTIEIHTGAREDWSLILTGAISDTIARSYFESGKACTMGGHGFIY